jgi:Ca2+-binding EF-hand superfamily protein
MMADAPGSGTINFTIFLTLFGERMSGTDPEHEILSAFEAFDERKTGFIDADMLRDALMTMGERFTDEEVHTEPIPVYLCCPLDFPCSMSCLYKRMALRWS